MSSPLTVLIDKREKKNARETAVALHCPMSAGKSPEGIKKEALPHNNPVSSAIPNTVENGDGSSLLYDPSNQVVGAGIKNGFYRSERGEGKKSIHI